MNLTDFLMPAVDIKEGRVVRLLKGDFSKEKVYFQNPTDLARKLEDLGFKNLHVVDLDGAKEGTPTNLEKIREIRKVFSGSIQVGGGIRLKETARILFEEGVDRVIVGTLAVKKPEVFSELVEEFPERVILAVDSKGGNVAVGGWQESSSLKPEDLALKYDSLPLWGYLYTLVERDGSLDGVDPEPYRVFKTKVSKRVIASGGVASEEDLKKLWGVVDYVVSGRALYEGKLGISLLLS